MNMLRINLKKKDLNIISLIFMDELGIADECQNNPLKLLHSRLDDNSEKTEKKDKFAFIGISNWTLDASKMNRTINIIVEEPNLNYIIETANEIVDSIKGNFLNKFKAEIVAISETYLEYVQEQKDRNKEDFHGFRDFYYLIYYIFYNIKENESESINKTFNFIMKGIYRNFAGFEGSEGIFTDKFLKKYRNERILNEYNVINRINDNLESKIDSRYLLLITENENEQINESILKYILKGKKYEIISDEDINKCDNEYNAVLNILLKIQVLMSKEIVLILKNLEILYPSLYELFNKNFYEYGNGNKFVKIYYENTKSLVVVNDMFRIIVLVQKDKLNLEEKPFLSRFEKQIFSFKTILKEEDLNYVNTYYNYILKIKEKLDFMDLDYIYEDLLYFIMSKYREKGTDKKIYFLKELVSLFPQEMIYSLNNDFKTGIIMDEQTKNDINSFFIESYKKNYNFKSFLSNINFCRNVIYTYSDINKSLLNGNDIIENSFFKMCFKSGDIKILDKNTMESFLIKEQSSKKIDEEKIKNYFEKNKYDLFIIYLNEEIIHDIAKNFDLKSFILEIEKYFNQDKTILLYIISKKRINKNNENNKISQNILQLFLSYNQVFIDNLYNIYQKDESIEDIFMNLVTKGKNIINNNKIMKNRILDDSFELIIFQIKNEIGNNYKNVEKIKRCLKDNEHIFKLINNKIRYLMDKKELIISEILINKGQDLIKSLFYKNMKIISILLKDIINYLEDDLALSTVLFANMSSDLEKCRLENDFKNILDKFDKNKNYNGIKYIYFGFNLVGLFKDYKKLNFEISSQNKENEKDFKKNIMEGIIRNTNYQFSKKLNSSVSSTEKKFLFNDYILYFISLVLEIKSFKEKRNEIMTFLNMILKLLILKVNDKFNTNIDYFDNRNYIDMLIDTKDKLDELHEYFFKMCLFFENNKQFLSLLLHSVNEFLQINPNFNILFINLYQKSKKKDDSLFKIFDVFLDCVKNEFNSFIIPNNEQNEKFIEFLQKNEEKFRKALSLLSKDYSLSLLNIEMFLYIIKNGKSEENSELLKNTLKFMNEEGKNNNFENKYAI